MPLRLVNKDRSYPITVEETTFHIVSMTIGEKEKLLFKLSDIETITAKRGESFSMIIDIIASVIIKIDGLEGEPKQILEQLEDVNQLQSIIKGIINHCNLSDTESKNSNSSSGQPTPESTGSAIRTVNPDADHVLDTQTKTV